MSLVYFTVPVCCSTPRTPPFLRKPSLPSESYEGKQERAEQNRHRLQQQKLSLLRQRLERISKLRERADEDAEGKKLELDRALEQALEKRNQLLEEGAKARSERTHQIKAKKTWLERLSSEQSETKRQVLAEQLYQAEVKRMAQLQRFKTSQQGLLSRKKQQELMFWERCQRKKSDLEQQLLKAELKRQDWLNRRRFSSSPSPSPPAPPSASAAGKSDQGSKEKRERLLRQLGKAERRRELLLHQQVAQCANQVARAKQVAAAQKQRQEERKRKTLLALQQRLERSETKRRLLASKKQRSNITVAAAAAAVKIQRWWRYLKCFLVVRLFKKRGLSPSQMKKLSFEQMTTRIQNPQAIRITDCLLGAMERLSGCSSEEGKGGGKRARIFLTSAMMSLHSEEIMGTSVELTLSEKSVLDAAKQLQANLRFWLCLFNSSKRPNGRPDFSALCKDQTRLSMLHQSFHHYLGCFLAWKEKDNSAMIELMTSHFDTLGRLWLRVREEEDAESWRGKILEQRLLLADQIKQLGGPELDPSTPLSAWQNELNLVVTEGGLSNEQLLHEIVLDPQFRLEPPSPPTNYDWGFVRGGGGGLAEEDLEFWVPLVINQLKQRVAGILPERYLGQVEDLLDVQLISQQLSKRVFNLSSLIRDLLNLFKSFCAPCRDAQVREFMEELPSLTGKVEEMLTRLFRLVEAMRLDMANFRITQVRPMLLRHGASYETSNFAQKLSKGVIKLDNTRAWLHPRPDYNEAFLDLLLNYAQFSSVLPETFTFDEVRLNRLNITAHRLCLIAAFFLLSSGARMTVDQLWTIDLDCFLEGGHDVEEEGGGGGGGDVINGALAQAVQGQGPVYELLRRRLRGSLKQAMLGGGGREEIPVGLERVANQLRVFQREVVFLSKWNYQVHQQWYVEVQE